MVGSKFIDGRMRFQRINGRAYMIDSAMVPALRHIPRELLPPILEALDRDMRARHAQWIRAVDRAARKRDLWIDYAMGRFERGASFASIGLAVNKRFKNVGSPDRIARTFAAYVGHRKK